MALNCTTPDAAPTAETPPHSTLHSSREDAPVAPPMKPSPAKAMGGVITPPPDSMLPLLPGSGRVITPVAPLARCVTKGGEMRVTLSGGSTIEGTSLPPPLKERANGIGTFKGAEVNPLAALALVLGKAHRVVLEERRVAGVTRERVAPKMHTGVRAGDGG